MKHKKRPIGKPKLIAFLSQLEELLSAGVPILSCFEILQTKQTHEGMTILLYKITKQIENGVKLSVCFSAYPHYFDPLTCHLLKVGEETGKLEILLKMVVNYQLKIEDNKSKIKQIVSYPLSVLVIAILLTFNLLYFIVPKFAEFILEMKMPVPLSTQILFNLSACLHQYLLILILGLMALIWIFFSYEYKKVLIEFGLRLPFVRNYIQYSFYANFASVLSILLTSGVPILKGLTLLKEIVYIKTYRPHLAAIHNSISAGRSFTQALSATAAFPGLMLQMVKIGEEAGTLDKMLQKIAKFYEKEAEQLGAGLLKMLEPLIMLMLGVLIGGIVIILYLPIFNLGSAF